MGKRLKVGVLASGGGTDLQSIIDALEKTMIDVEVVVVISDNQDAYALKRAENHHITHFFVDPTDSSFGFCHFRWQSACGAVYSFSFSWHFPCF